MLSEEQKIRYSRQIAIPEIGIEGQEKLLKSKVLIIGSGALGSMAAMQLAGAGIGEIGVADFDKIDISNLQRQFFFTTGEVGKSKVEVLSERIKNFNPAVKVHILPYVITSGKASKIFPQYDFIIDATDNPDSKKMVGKISLERDKACCIGGVSTFKGQVITLLPADPRFEDYFGQGEEEGFLPCSLSGVIGPAAALCASIQAAEAIKYLTGAGNTLSGKLLTFDLSLPSFHLFTL